MPPQVADSLAHSDVKAMFLQETKFISLCAHQNGTEASHMTFLTYVALLKNNYNINALFLFLQEKMLLAKKFT